MRYFKVKLRALIPSEGEVLLEANSEAEARAKATQFQDHRRVTYLAIRFYNPSGQGAPNSGAEQIQILGVTEVDIDNATDEQLKEFLEFKEEQARCRHDDAFWAEYDKRR